MTWTPRRRNSYATALLREPMPPVRPTRKVTFKYLEFCGNKGLIFETAPLVNPLLQRLKILGPEVIVNTAAPEHGNDTRHAEVGAEGNGHFASAAGQHDEADADHGPHHRGQQDDRGEQAPAQPRPDGPQQLEVAVA